MRVPRRDAIGTRGFTMIELLIALVVAGVIGSSIFFVFRSQSRVFFVQETVSATQGELRFAMQTIKGDLKRAGFLAGINTQADFFWCGNRPVPPITALQVTDGDGFVHLPAENVNIAPDSIRVLGAFTANNSFYTERVTGNVVQMSADPILSPGFPTTATDYDRLLPPGALFRIVDSSNRYQIQRITNKDFTGRTVTLQAINRNSVMGCGPRGLGQGLLVNPVEYIRYRIVDTSNSGNPGLCANSGAVVGRSTLVRESLGPDGTTVLSTIPVADYVVDMQFSFMRDLSTLGSVPNIPPDLNPYDFTGNVDVATINANPQQARAVRIFLAARTAQEIPGAPFTPRPLVTVGGNSGVGPLTSFNLDTDRTSSARVRSLSSEVQLRNFGLSPRL